MRLTVCLAPAAALALQPLHSPRRQPSTAPRRRRHSSSQSLDDVDADFRRLLATGLTPTDAFTPVDVAALTLRALKTGDERFLHRFSTPDFAPAGVKRRGSTFEGLGNGQYALLREEYTADLDDDVLVLGDEAFLRVRLEDASDAHVTLGWELRLQRGCWLTSRWHWHDFRPEFHPGIGEEEWTRICG